MEYMKAPPPKAADGIFLQAVANSKVSDLIKLLEQQEANIDCQNTNGASGLHIACVNQLSNVVKVLIIFGAKIDIEEHHFAGKRTPLHYAVKNDNYGIAKLLLDAGANPNPKDDQGTTP